MKVTAIIPDDLINKVKILTKGENTTESLITALRQWISIKELGAVTKKIRNKPLTFRTQEIAKDVRALNRGK